MKENQQYFYQVFVLIQLALSNKIFPNWVEISYDEIFPNGMSLYDEFLESNFNINEMSEYDCIERFLGEYSKVVELDLRSSICVVNKVEIDVLSKTYCVSGDGFPTQTITFDDFSDWDCIKGFDGSPLLDCQIDYDDGGNNDGFQFQCVNLVYTICGDYDQGSQWNTPHTIEVINCGGFDISINFGSEIGTQVIGGYKTKKEADEYVKVLKNSFLTGFIVPNEWQGGLGDIQNIWIEPTNNAISEREEFIDIQIKELKIWKLKLISECYNDLLKWATKGNSKVDIDSIKRGSDLDGFISSWEQK